MKPIKIGFVLLSPSHEPLPSTRVVVLNMLPFLRAAHFDPHIVFEPPRNTEQPELPEQLAQRLAAEGFRIVFFQKARGTSVQQLVRRLSALGIKTVFGVCDLVDIEMVARTDATVAVTDHLRTLYPPALQSKIHVVHDGIENPDSFKTDWGTHRGSALRPLRAVLVTSASLVRLPIIDRPPPWLEVTVVGRYAPRVQWLRRVREARWKLQMQDPAQRRDTLQFMLNRRIHCAAWDPAGVYRHLNEADVGIIPVEATPDPTPNLPVPLWSVKSENRLTMKMAAGLPVVASPIPSYEPVMRHGVDGFFAGTREEWLDCLETLRDPAVRREIGTRARAAVLHRYSMDEQARRLVDVLHGLVQDVAVSAAVSR